MIITSGKCEFCGKETDLINIEDMDICEECADKSYAYCDHCRGYLPKENTIMYYLKNGMNYCEDCAIYALNFSGLTDDDIDHIEGLDDDEDCED